MTRRSSSWRRWRGALGPALPLAALAVPVLVTLPPAERGWGGPTGKVIVQEVATGSSAAERVVAELGGTVGPQLHLIGGFAATVPAAAIPTLQEQPSVRRLWRDGAVTMSDTPDMLVYDRLPPNTVWRQAIGLPSLPAGTTGAGVTVAVLDTGITRKADFGNRVVARVDLTPDGGGYDTYGHGTHMAGIVGGDGRQSSGRWTGVAPGARIISVKVAEWNGATDVSQVLAGLEWVAVNRARYNIRVLNLSFGTDSSQSYLIDPLNFAVERLWGAGVFVVAAAGNRGTGGQRIDKPGDDPYVLTVGAADTRGTVAVADDTVAPFSSRGPTTDNIAKPDLVAPGMSIVSQRAPGSTADALRPAARVGSGYFKGTGTSQAAAVVSGTAALMFQAAPALTPDEAKAALVNTTSPALRGVEGAGAGLVHAGRAVQAAEDRAFRHLPANRGLRSSSGLGSIDSSRGNAKPYTDLTGDGTAEQVSGEIDALGNRWQATTWTTRPWNATTWPSSPWAGLTHVSPGWTQTPWPGDTWSGLGWDEGSWSAKSWADAGLTPDTWPAKSWYSEAWN